MAEKGKLIFEYPNFKTRWVWRTWIRAAIILQIGWIIILGILFFRSELPIIPSLSLLILISEFTVFMIVFIAYDDSNSFGTPFKIYENGIISPRRTIRQYLKAEVNYIPFNEIKKIKIEKYKGNPKFDYIKFESTNDRVNLRFLFSMIGFEKGINILESTLKDKIPTVWKHREIINN